VRKSPVRWQELADLPFAQVLTAHGDGLMREEAYDGAHFDQEMLEDADGSGSHFLECAFTGVSLQGCRLERTQYAEVWLHDVRVIATSLARTSWRDVTFTGSVLAGVEAFGSLLRGVTFDRCKLDGVNFRDCDLTDVTFDSCVLRDVDFGGARLTRTKFPQSQLAATIFTKVTLSQVDLRGAELGIIVDPVSLSGAIVTTSQLIDMAPLLAESIGIVVQDQ
jgi:uncharacterized protein YjbI with pentapeptide repeats